MPTTPPANDAALMALCLLADQEKTLPLAPLPVQAALMREKIVRGLASQPPIAGQWELAWGPGLTHANMAFAAREKATGQVAVVVRGSDFAFVVDWIEDFDVLTLVPFPYVPAPDARIAKGTSLAMQDVLSMTGPVFVPDAPPVLDQGLLQFLLLEATRQGGSQSVAFTGHSLGGAVASVLAPWGVATSKGWSGPPLQVRCCTFAAPSAGNGVFAAATAPLYGAAPSRYVDQFDVVPRAWADVASIAALFPGGPACPQDVRELVEAAGVLLKAYDYQQPTAGWTLPTPVAREPTFFAEVAYQHSSVTYLQAMTGTAVERVVTVTPRVGPKAPQPQPQPAQGGTQPRSTPRRA